MLWDPFLMKKLIKNGVCGSMNSAHVHCSQLKSQQNRLWRRKKKIWKRERRRAIQTAPLVFLFGTTYLIKIENFLLKILLIKIKVSWNNTVRLINSIKNTIKLINNSKNNLNSKITQPKLLMNLTYCERHAIWTWDIDKNLKLIF